MTGPLEIGDLEGGNTVQRTKWQRVSVLSTGSGNGVTPRAVAVAVALAHQHPLVSGRGCGVSEAAGGMGYRGPVSCGLRRWGFHRQLGAEEELKERQGVAGFSLLFCEAVSHSVDSVA